MKRVSFGILALSLSILACSPLTNVLQSQTAPTQVFEIEDAPVEQAQVESILEDTAPQATATIPEDSQALPEVQATLEPQADDNISDIETTDNATPEPVQAEAQPTATAEQPTAIPEEPTAETADPTPAPTEAPAISLPQAMANALAQVEIEPRNLSDVAERLKDVGDIPDQVSTTPANHQVGTTLTFNATNTSTNASFQVDARLVAFTEHVYFFADTTVNPNVDDVNAVLNIFENEIYPTTRNFFGSEWSPGVDGDPHLYILYARGLGGAAGYYGSSDQYSSLANQFSNEKEMFYINADAVPVNGSSMLGILAHEFQHMIHWNQDGNEESWLNEGASELSAYLNGYGASQFVPSFLNAPDLQLNTWSETGYGGAHYGAGFLFIKYFLDRIGTDATIALIGDSANGLTSVERILAQTNLIDPVTNQPITLEDLFADWVVTNYRNDPGIGDGRYFYLNYPNFQTISGPTASYSNCPANTGQQTVSQFAADYYEFTCAGDYTLSFRGNNAIQVVPTSMHSGEFAAWSNRVDNSTATMTRSFDLSGVSNATLDYWTWYRIEPDYDYAYVEISTDGGNNWTILQTPNGTDRNPVGNSFGWGYNGESGGNSTWINERVDLTPYVGQSVQIRFEYLTDDAVNQAGWLIDDIAIPEIGYIENFDSGSSDWETKGFVALRNELPQTFGVQLLRENNGTTTIEKVAVPDNQAFDLTLNIASGETVTVIVYGTTRNTTQAGTYELSIN